MNCECYSNYKNENEIMILVLGKIKVFTALVCIGSMALLLGVPVIPKEKVKQILQTNNQHIAADVIQADDEKS